MNKHTAEALARLQSLGVSWNDALALRRISMTLHRWHELECGDGNDYGSWCISRGHKSKDGFIHDDEGAPYLEHHHYGSGKTYTTYSRLPDRERGAIKRLKALMAKYGYIGLSWYIQGDPRGAALYILRPGDVPEGGSPDAYYSAGVAVFK